MDLFEIVVLALIQGLTEFLPISSSAHLILPSQVFGWPDQGLAFDVAVHIGSLSAVLIYFRKDIVGITRSWFSTGFAAKPSQEAKLGWFIIIASVPACLAGLLFNGWIETELRSMTVIAWTTILFGLVLGLADRAHSQRFALSKMTLTMVLVIGFAQALALIPGVSRSGVTLTAALLVGLQRVDAARFSFLLSIPLILAAGGLQSYKLLNLGSAVNWNDLLLGVVVSAVSAWLCIHYFLIFINRIGMMPFVIYRLVLGIALLALPYFSSLG